MPRRDREQSVGAPVDPIDDGTVAVGEDDAARSVVERQVRFGAVDVLGGHVAVAFRVVGRCQHGELAGLDLERVDRVDLPVAGGDGPAVQIDAPVAEVGQLEPLGSPLTRRRLRVEHDLGDHDRRGAGRGAPGGLTRCAEVAVRPRCGRRAPVRRLQVVLARIDQRHRRPVGVGERSSVVPPDAIDLDPARVGDHQFVEVVVQTHRPPVGVVDADGAIALGGDAEHRVAAGSDHERCVDGEPVAVVVLDRPARHVDGLIAVVEHLEELAGVVGGPPGVLQDLGDHEGLRRLTALVGGARATEVAPRHDRGRRAPGRHRIVVEEDVPHRQRAAGRHLDAAARMPVDAVDLLAVLVAQDDPVAAVEQHEGVSVDPVRFGAAVGVGVGGSRQHHPLAGCDRQRRQRDPVALAVGDRPALEVVGLVAAVGELDPFPARVVDVARVDHDLRDDDIRSDRRAGRPAGHRDGHRPRARHGGEDTNSRFGDSHGIFIGRWRRSAASRLVQGLRCGRPPEVGRPGRSVHRLAVCRTSRTCGSR